MEFGVNDVYQRLIVLKRRSKRQDWVEVDVIWDVGYKKFQLVYQGVQERILLVILVMMGY